MKPPAHIPHADIILNSIADGVFTVDEHLTITYFNKAAERIIGFQQQDALGQYCYDVFRTNICETACPIRSALAGGTQTINQPINILRKDGRTLAVSISTSGISNSEGRIVGGVETFRDLSAIEELKREISKSYSFEDIISKNRTIQQIFDILPNIAESCSTVLIEGPSGSGKELFARAIHNLSQRRNGPFVAINCSALPDSLLESELFGYVKGAFTDARKDKPGRFALAQNGTIFLDEVESLAKPTQVKLLRVLQEREYEPLGATQSVKADFRILAASNMNLKEMVRNQTFRDDLYFRLNVVKIVLPKLCERRDDIPLLVEYLINKFNTREGASVSGVSADVMNRLMQYDYPGNVRELENIIEYAFVMNRTGLIQCQHLPPEFGNSNDESVLPAISHNGIHSLEKKLIIDTLNKMGGKRQEAADELGIHRSTLWRKMQQYGLNKKGAC